MLPSELVNYKKKSRKIIALTAWDSISGSIAGAKHIHTMAKAYGVPVILHTDHCAKKLLPWIDGLMLENEKCFKENGHSLFSSHMLCFMYYKFWWYNTTIVN